MYTIPPDYRAVKTINFMEHRNKIEVIDASGVLDEQGHIRPEIMAILAFGATGAEAVEDKAQAVSAHLESCKTCQEELKEVSEEERMAS